MSILNVITALDAPVTVVEYGDFESPYCGRAEAVVRELLGDFGDVRYIWRHLLLSDVHPNAQLSREAAVAPANQVAPRARPSLTPHR
jgi:protein-disulfide isomerase